MNPELIISISFMAAVIIEGVILLKNFFSAKVETEFSKLLFRFLSNSFVYAAALLIFISSFSNNNGLEIINFQDLSHLSLGQTTIWVILIADAITLLILSIGLVSKLLKKDNKQEEKIIDQQKAKKLI
ncbi:hypothetical protein Halha_1295 [Halobacteroides halobius DSM 5150]|uniref:Uncharacterized protein n=1 Tax=Halobacteroides halobius (strain ATCC 35273 / DSM 5150 / MD-1) TaxID=748449 RepID=L0K890_HALHC|nr:hypothetical protein [Halobacteroides halobius]AGB41241.1 hypothetical protein Halha_1295 [Halobacteroides halobius DSM 5150]